MVKEENSYIYFFKSVLFSGKQQRFLIKGIKSLHPSLLLLGERLTRLTTTTTNSYHL